jgi:hypothetical protein
MRLSAAAIFAQSRRDLAAFFVRMTHTMLRTTSVLVSLLALSFAASADEAPPPLTDPVSASSLQIQIDRFGAINGQARDAITFIRGKAPKTEEFDEDDHYSPKGLYRRLYRNVVELNLIIVDGCHAGILKDEQCNTLWRDWLKFPGQESYTLEEIQTYTDDIQGAEVMIWTALCDEAKKKGAEEHFCAME